MPTYKLTDQNTGRTIKVSGDTPPTEEEVSKLFEDTRLDAIKSMESKLADKNLPEQDRTAIGEKYVKENAEYKRSKGVAGRAMDMIKDTDVGGAAKGIGKAMLSAPGKILEQVEKTHDEELAKLGTTREDSTLAQRANALGYSLSRNIGEAGVGALTGVADAYKMIYSGAQKLIAEAPVWTPVGAAAAGVRKLAAAAQPDAPKTVAIDSKTGKEVDLSTLVTPDGRKLSEVVEPKKEQEVDQAAVAARSDLARINQSVAYEKAVEEAAKATIGGEPGAIYDAGRVVGGAAAPVSIPGLPAAAGALSQVVRGLAKTGAQKTLGAALRYVPKAGVLAADTALAGLAAKGVAHTAAAGPLGWLTIPAEIKAATNLIGDNAFGNLGRHLKGLGKDIPDVGISRHTGLSKYSEYVGEALDKVRTKFTENKITGAGRILLKDLPTAGEVLMEQEAKRLGEIMGTLKNPEEFAKLSNAQKSVLNAERKQITSRMASIEAGRGIAEKLGKLTSIPEPLADVLAHSVVGATIGTGLAAASSTPGQENVLGHGAAGGAFYGAILSQLGRAALALKEGKPGEAKTLTPEDIDTIVNSKEFADQVKGMTDEVVKEYEGPKGLEPEGGVLANVKPGPQGLPELNAEAAPKEPVLAPKTQAVNEPKSAVLAPKAEPVAEPTPVAEPEAVAKPEAPAIPELMPSQAKALAGLQTELPMKISSKKTPALTAARSELQKLSDQFEAMDKKYTEEGLTPDEEAAYDALRMEVEAKTSKVAKLEAKEVKKARRLKVDTEKAPESTPAMEKPESKDVSGVEPAEEAALAPKKLTPEEVRAANEANYAKWQEGRDAWVENHAAKLSEKYTDKEWTKAEALRIWEKNRAQQAAKAFGADSELAKAAKADFDAAAEKVAELEKPKDVAGVEPAEEAALAPKKGPFTEDDVKAANKFGRSQRTPEELNSDVEKFRNGLIDEASKIGEIPPEIMEKIDSLTEKYISDIKAYLAWTAKNPGMMATGPAANSKSSKPPAMSITKEVLDMFEQNVNGVILRRKAAENAPKREAEEARLKNAREEASKSVESATKQSVSTPEGLLQALNSFSKTKGRTQQKAMSNSALKLIKDRGLKPDASAEDIQGLYNDVVAGKGYSNYLPKVVNME